MLLGLKERQRAPTEVVVEQWMGISADEWGRAKAPGRFVKVKRTIRTLFGEEVVKIKEWRPMRWKVHTFPLLNTTLLPDRRSRREKFFAQEMTRQHCVEWLAREFPGRRFPRSACICCPFRTNKEWRELRDTAPDDFDDACRFDDEARLHPEAGLRERKEMAGRRVGQPFVHRSMIPLRMVDLDADDPAREPHCGVLGEGTCEGMCGV
jgi:hypothetical protein